uniref:RNA-directed DNA polymerase n=1 Tax=Caenorhabditis japonica TaxID=281687 RepID=A0A8R1DGC6_CAEJA
MIFRDFNLKAYTQKSKTTYTPDKANVAKIVEFPTTTNVNEVRMVVGMAGFFKKFIPRFSEITEPLTRLTRKDKKFEWNAEQQAAFEKLRDALASEPCYDISIIHIDGKKNTVADCLSRARENDEPAEYTELKDIIEFPVCMKVQPGTPQTNRTLVVKRNQPTSVLDITEEQDGDPDILVIKKVLQDLRSPL